MAVEVDAWCAAQSIARQVFADLVVKADGVQNVFLMQGVQAQLLGGMETKYERAFADGLPDGLDFPGLNLFSGEIESLGHNARVTYKLIIRKGDIAHLELVKRQWKALPLLFRSPGRRSLCQENKSEALG